MHKKGVIFAIAITIAALLLCCGIRLYRDRDERKLRQFLEQQAYSALELDSVRFVKKDGEVYIEYYIVEDQTALTEALQLRHKLEEYLKENTSVYSDMQVGVRIFRPNSTLGFEFYNFDWFNDDHRFPPEKCQNCFDLHYTYLLASHTASLSLLTNETDFEELVLSGFTEYDIDALSNMENLRYLSIADENAPAHLFEAETYSELPEDCEVVVNNHHDIR
ncbi:MAG: hypothetical protein E7503_05760 [Ruminococcus sp.]|nr:hypothetical protein [Ruminococcus sp.]